MSNGRRMKKVERLTSLIILALFLVTVVMFINYAELEKQAISISNQRNLILDDLYPMTADLRIRMRFLEANIKRAESDIEELKNGQAFPEFNAEVSWYTAGVESTGKSPGDKGYGITASGELVKPTYTIAADSRFPFGTKILIDGIVYVVEDRGSLIYDNRIDIFVESLNEIPPEGRVIKKAYILEWGIS